MSALGRGAGAGPDLDSPQLRFWVTAADGLHYEVDLVEFARGGRADEVRCFNRETWGGDFRGRPGFAAQIAELFRLEAPSSQKSVRLRCAMRCLLRFLDVVDPDGCVRAVGDLTDAHGLEFRRWAEAVGASHHYVFLLNAVGRMRELGGQAPLLWPARKPDRPPLLDDVDQQGLRRLFHAFRHEARAVKRMFAEGEQLANSGQDPRGGTDEAGPETPGWHNRRDQAWLVRHLTGRRLLSKAEIREQGGQSLYKTNCVARPHLGPAYLPPGMGGQGSRGVFEKLRWFHPAYEDIAVYLWLFLLATGWNLATCLSLDVSEEAAWVHDHPYKTDAKLLHAYKSRAGRQVFAFSAVRPEFHPYQILKFIIARTEPLRETLRHRLAAEERRCATKPSHASEAEIARLRGAIRSPWLYQTLNRVGFVEVITNEDNTRLNKIARITAQRAGLLEQHPALAAMTTAVARDGWMAHAYEQSGYSVIMAQLAGQHSDARSLLHYLRRRRYRSHSELAMRRVQNAAFAEIEAGRPLDATRLRLLVESGGVTPEQEKRLLDHRMRTRLGMGCLDPSHPPRHVSPNHREGTLCRVQRCTGCQLGVVFEESLRPLARRQAELLHLQRSLPFAVWAQSSFGDELRSIALTLEHFDPEQVRTVTEEWQAKLGSGEVAVHDTYPI